MFKRDIKKLTKLVNIHRNSLLAVMVVFSFSMTGCGGGGGSESNTATAEPVTEPVTISVTVPLAAPDYSPNTDKLSSEAETSADLFVETEFNFSSYKEIGLDINVQSLAGERIEDSLVYISSIPDDVVEFDDEDIKLATLIAVTKTDSNGHSLLRFETTQRVNNLLIEISALGVNNQHIIDINEQDYQILNLN